MGIAVVNIGETSAPTKQRISKIQIQRNVASNIASVWADSHTIVEKIYGWVQEMEPPARGDAALVLGEQADVLQEPEGPDLGSLQCTRGSQVWSVLEWQRTHNISERFRIDQESSGY